ncbi:MAG: hypothetical protein J7L61_02340 [Thermoplasmata archaeon]|nr:hypothetical protein [Thermoplasmata archaeon]
MSGQKGGDGERGLREVREGLAVVLAGNGRPGNAEEQNRKGARGPASRNTLFYNPAMRPNRDISVLLAAAVLKMGGMGKGRRGDGGECVEFLDGMASTGIRSIRWLRELPLLLDTSPVLRIHLADTNPACVEEMGRNLERNGIPEIQYVISGGDCRRLLYGRRFHMVDLDPYGTAAPYIQAGIEGTANGGILAVTTTDTGVLAGTYRETCIRRYHAVPLKNHLGHEAGLRLFLGYMMRTAMSLDTALEPLLCYYSDHYIRVYVRVKRSRNAARKMMEEMAMGVYVSPLQRVEKNPWPATGPATGKGERREGTEGKVFGPLWGGPLMDKDILDAMEEIHTAASTPGGERSLWDPKTSRLLDILHREAAVEPHTPWFFHDLDRIASHLHTSPPRMKDVISFLSERGYVAGRTHFSPTGFKTDAPPEEIERAFGIR